LKNNLSLLKSVIAKKGIIKKGRTILLYLTIAPENVILYAVISNIVQPKKRHAHSEFGKLTFFFLNNKQPISNKKVAMFSIIAGI
jgi:hypothetical protein